MLIRRGRSPTFDGYRLIPSLALPKKGVLKMGGEFSWRITNAKSAETLRANLESVADNR